MKDFLTQLEAEYCSVSEQDFSTARRIAPGLDTNKSGCPASRVEAHKAHMPEQFSLPLENPSPGVRPPVYEVLDVEKLPPLANAKLPYYENQKEKPVHRAMLYLAAKGYDVKEIAARVGRTPVCVNNILRQPMLQETLVSEVKKQNGEDETVVQIIKENVVHAVKTLAHIIRDDKAKGSDRIAAANALLERRYGKANQPINRGTDVDLNKLSDAELAAMLPSTRATATS